MTMCSQTSTCVLTSIGCFIYNFQTLLVGVVAICVAIFAGIPVWRQLKDTSLQTRISHRETLATLLRDALQRYSKVDASISGPLAEASQRTSDWDGEPREISAEEAHHLDGELRGVLDWYLIVLAETEAPEIESRKAALKQALDHLGQILNEAHWADHNEQHDEDHSIPDDEWARILARCDEAKREASGAVSETAAAYRKLREAQDQWVHVLRRQIAAMDRQISQPR
jgi:hypothetical protein